MARMTQTEKDAQAARTATQMEYLRSLLKPGDTVYTILVFSTGTDGRSYDVLLARNDQVFSIAYAVAQVTSYTRDLKHGGIKNRLSDGNDIVYQLGRVLFPDGFECNGKGYGNWGTNCPSNDHFNERGAENYCRTRTHEDGGYSLRHSSL